MTLFLFEESPSDGRQSQFSGNCELQFFLREISLYFRTKEQSQNTAQQNYPGSVIFYDAQPGNKVDWIGLCSVLCPRQHSIGYMGDGFYRSKDPTNSIKVLKEDLQKTKQTTKTTKSHI